MTPRDNLLVCVSGRKRVGKTHESLKQLLYYAYFSKTKRKSLYMDVNNEGGAYKVDGVVHNIKKIPHNGIIQYSNQDKCEVRRIVPIHDDGRMMDEVETENLLLKVCREFRGGILLIDDLNLVFGDALPVKFSGLLCNNAHRDCDIIIQIQSVGRLIPKLLQNINIVRFHAQLDDLDDSKGKLKGDHKIFKITQNMVNKQVKSGNMRFFVYVNRDISKIQGAYSQKMLAEAIQEFLLDNPREMYTVVNRRDPSGKKMYTFEEALQIKTRELFDEFYGNQPPPPAK